MKVRVTYGLDKLKDGLYYHEQHIIDDLKALSEKSTEYPRPGLPATSTKGLDTEYAKDGELLTVGFANEGLAEGLEMGDLVRPIIKRQLRETKFIVGHNVPGDVDQLAKNGFQLHEDWYTGKKTLDSYLLAKMVDENKPRGSYNVETLMTTNYRVQPWKGPTEKKLKETGDARDWTSDERAERCRLDAWGAYMLAKKFYPLVATTPQKRLLVETIHRIGMTLYRIGLAGARVDGEYLKSYQVDNRIQMAQLEQTLRTYATGYGWDRPEPFTPTHDDDIRHLLYDIRKLPPVGYTKGGLATVDKTSLNQYKEQLPTFIPLLLDYNKVQKADSVFGDLQSVLDDHGYIHWWLTQLGARTGRRSSGGAEDAPSTGNSQNWNKRAREMVISRFIGGKIGAFDYQSLEPVLYAWISRDENLFDFFYNGRGYLDICKRVLGKDIDKKDPIYRAIKSMSLGIFYNMQDKKMAVNLWLGFGMPEPFRFSEDFGEHKKQVGIYRRQILGLFPGLTRYMEGQKLKLARDKFIEAPDGFVRHLPHKGEGGERYWNLVNQAINFPVQHLASMVTGCALIDCEAAVLNENRISYGDWHTYLSKERDKFEVCVPTLINEVHDELTWDFPYDCIHDPANKDVELILSVMSRPPTLTKLIPGFNINLKIEDKVRERWGQE